MFEQQQPVETGFTYRRDGDGEHRQPVIEVGPEASGLHFLAQVADHLLHVGVQGLNLAVPLLPGGVLLAGLRGAAFGASTADLDVAEARLLAAIAPWLVGRGNEAPASQILALLGERSLHLQEGESRGALLTMCHGHPALTAGFSHTLSDDLTQLAVPAAPLSLTIGRAGPDGVPLLLCADGQLHGQTLKVSHPDPASGRRILAFAALDMLRRHLLGLPVLADFLTLTRTARGQEGARG